MSTKRTALAALAAIALGLGAATVAGAQDTLPESLVTDTVPEHLVTDTIPASYVKPRVGRLVKVRRPLSSLSRRGLSFPLACYGPCSAEGAMVMSGIAGAILHRYGFSARSVIVGRGSAKTAAGGSFALKLKLSRKGKRLMRKLRKRRMKVRVRAAASDKWGKSSRSQTITVTR